MKRSGERHKLSRPVMATVAFSSAQLTQIGAVAMTYNDAEQELHNIVSTCIHYDGNAREITSRINGIDGIIAIVKASSTTWKLPSDTQAVVDTALAGFGQLKTLRDAAIHSRMQNAALSIGLYPRHKAIIEEVLLSLESLQRLYKALEILHAEMDELLTIFMWSRELRDGGSLYSTKHGRKWHALDDQRREYALRAVQAATALCQRHQSRRLSLPPFPEFPEVPPR